MVTKEYIEENLLDIKGNLKFTKVKNEFPSVTKEELYSTYKGETPLCQCGLKKTFISFQSGYKECKRCLDIKGFYSIDNLRKYSISKVFTSTQITKIKKYHSLSLKDIYLWHNEKKFCPICTEECKFIKQTKGYAKSCSAKCGSKLKRRKLSLEEEKNKQEKRKKTTKERYGVECNLQLLDRTGHKNPMHDVNSTGYIKKKKTMFKRYGVEYPTQNKELLDKAVKSRIKNCSNFEKIIMPSFKKTKDDKLFNLYSKMVDKCTRESIRAHKIPNIEKRGMRELLKDSYHLDHKFSKLMGYVYSVPTHIIGHYKNLEIIRAQDNVNKGAGCSISLEDLLKEVYEK